MKYLFKNCRFKVWIHHETTIAMSSSALNVCWMRFASMYKRQISVISHVYYKLLAHCKLSVKQNSLFSARILCMSLLRSISSTLFCRSVVCHHSKCVNVKRIVALWRELLFLLNYWLLERIQFSLWMKLKQKKKSINIKKRKKKLFKFSEFSFQK